MKNRIKTGLLIIASLLMLQGFAMAAHLGAGMTLDSTYAKDYAGKKFDNVEEQKAMIGMVARGVIQSEQKLQADKAFFKSLISDYDLKATDAKGNTLLLEVVNFYDRNTSAGVVAPLSGPLFQQDRYVGADPELVPMIVDSILEKYSKSDAVKIIDMQNEDGNTALILAAADGSFDAVDALIKAGANPSLTNHNKTNALMEAEFSYDYWKNVAPTDYSLTMRYGDAAKKEVAKKQESLTKIIDLLKKTETNSEVHHS